MNCYPQLSFVLPLREEITPQLPPRMRQTPDSLNQTPTKLPDQALCMSNGWGVSVPQPRSLYMITLCRKVMRTIERGCSL